MGMRMRFLKWSAAAFGCLAIAAAGSAQGQGSEAIGPQAVKTLPIADAHFHVMPYMDLGQLIEAMDRHNILWAGGASALGGPARNVEVVRMLGKRYIRPAGPAQWLGLKQRGGVAALENADGFDFRQALEAIEADLRDRGARVIGELHVNALQSAANPTVNHKIRADAPTLKALLALAGKYQRPLSLHAQWDADTAAEFQRLAESNRGARLILSHAGNTAGAADIRALLEKNPNVVCDLSFRSPPQLKGRNLGRTIFDDGLRAEWRSLIEDFPDRFSVGIDDVHSWDDYEATAKNIRFGLLANLSPGTAEKVAFRNAKEWFGLE